MFFADSFLAGQVGNSSRNFEYSAQASSRQIKPACHHREIISCIVIKSQAFPHEFFRNLGVAAQAVFMPAFLLNVSCFDYPLSDCLARLQRNRTITERQQLFRRESRHMNLKVYSVHDRPGKFPPVAFYVVLTARTLNHRVSCVAARTRIRREHKQNARGILYASCRTADGDFSVLNRCA